jgi:hypothetical protein
VVYNREPTVVVRHNPHDDESVRMKPNWSMMSTRRPHRVHARLRRRLRIEFEPEQL